jgi:hypothetical protein
MSHRKQTSTQRTRPTAKVAARFDVAMANVALLALGLAFFVGYLVMNSQASTKGFAIRTAESTISKLEDERKKLDIDAVAAQSLHRVEEQVSGLGMVQVKGVEYLSTAPPSVAVR